MNQAEGVRIVKAADEPRSGAGVRPMKSGTGLRPVKSGAVLWPARVTQDLASNSSCRPCWKRLGNAPRHAAFALVAVLAALSPPRQAPATPQAITVESALEFPHRIPSKNLVADATPVTSH